MSTKIEICRDCGYSNDDTGYPQQLCIEFVGDENLRKMYLFPGLINLGQLRIHNQDVAPGFICHYCYEYRKSHHLFPFR